MQGLRFECPVPLHVKRLRLLQALTGVNIWTIQALNPTGSWKSANPVSTGILFASPDIIRKNGEPVIFYVSVSLVILELCDIPQIARDHTIVELPLVELPQSLTATDIHHSLLNLLSALGVRMTGAAPSVADMQAFLIETLGTK